MKCQPLYFSYLVQLSGFAQPAKQTASSKAFTVKNKYVLKTKNNLFMYVSQDQSK